MLDLLGMDPEPILATIYAIIPFVTKRPGFTLGLIGSILGFLYFLTPFIEQVKVERDRLRSSHSSDMKGDEKSAGPMKNPIIGNPAVNPSGKEHMKDDKPSISTGAISPSHNSGNVQINVGSPGSSQIVNHLRKFKNEVKIEPIKRGNDFVLRLILTQTGNIWDSGTPLEIHLKLSGPFTDVKIVEGLPPARLNVQTSEDKANGFFTYSTTTAPYPDRPVVLEVLSVHSISVEKFSATPVAD